MDPIRLLFDSKNHLMVIKNAVGVYDLAEIEIGSYVWHKLTTLKQQPILCAVLAEGGGVTNNWQTIFYLRSVSKTPKLAAVLEAIDGELHCIPYFGMGENEYIYRFRTKKERNRSVYIDSQSETLYQSALCLAIKEARRNKEKSPSEAAVLDFGAVSYVIPSHFRLLSRCAECD